MSRMFRTSAFQFTLALLTGLGLGLAYSWLLSPVTYVDATPALLRSDFKDQYRIVIAAAYAANQDLPRAQARLNLLGDADPIAELSAQAQRMLATGESFEKARPLAQLATDLQRGVVSEPFTATPFPTFSAPDIVFTSTPDISESVTVEDATSTLPPTVFFEQTPLTPLVQGAFTPRPTFTPTPGPGASFVLVSQEPLCEPGKITLMQFLLLDSRNNQVPGIEIVVTWSRGEDRFFTGFKPELGDGYADFIMEAGTVYNIRVAGGAIVTDLRAPLCTDPNSAEYSGGVLLTFQRP
jgi:hypothetical protein